MKDVIQVGRRKWVTKRIQLFTVGFLVTQTSQTFIFRYTINTALTLTLSHQITTLQQCSPNIRLQLVYSVSRDERPKLVEYTPEWMVGHEEEEGELGPEQDF